MFKTVFFTGFSHQYKVVSTLDLGANQLMVAILSPLYDSNMTNTAYLEPIISVVDG